jgi:hypothetical protein
MKRLNWSEEATELAYRADNGIEVALLWTRATGTTVVAVLDAARGEEFEVEVRPGDSPLDIFRHPYAYAVLRDLGLMAA